MLTTPTRGSRIRARPTEETDTVESGDEGDGVEPQRPSCGSMRFTRSTEKGELLGEVLNPRGRRQSGRMVCERGSVWFRSRGNLRTGCTLVRLCGPRMQHGLSVLLTPAGQFWLLNNEGVKEDSGEWTGEQAPVDQSYGRLPDGTSGSLSQFRPPAIPIPRTNPRGEQGSDRACQMGRGRSPLRSKPPLHFRINWRLRWSPVLVLWGPEG